MLFLALYLPHWQLDFLRYRHGLEPSRAMVLYDPVKARIVSRCDIARAAGIAPGQSMATAALLAPALEAFPGSAALAQQAREFLCRQAYSFSARVVPPGLEGLCPDSLLLEVGSMAQIFGGLPPLLLACRRRFETLGFSVSLALGPTPLSAQLLARHSPLTAYGSGSGSGSGFDTDSGCGAEGGWWPQESKYLTPADAAQVPPSDFAAQAKALTRALGSVPVEMLPLDDDSLARLAGMGIVQLQMLLALPAAELGIRFGPGLPGLLARIRGDLPQPLEYYRLPEHYRHKQELLFEACELQGLVFVLGRMFAELALYLRQRQLALQQLTLSLHYRDPDAAPLQLELSYPFAEYQAEALLSLCRLQLERHSLSQPVVALTLAARHFVPRRQLTKSQGLMAKEQQQEILLARLEARLGARSLKRLSFRDALLPESAWQAHGAGEPCKGGGLSPRQRLACRPAWLLPAPSPIAADDIVLLRGPERFRSPWWQQQPQQRDYYLARHRDGGLCWVFRSRIDGDLGLYLHGWF
ncbi:DNA polymerase Y family protein [Shewanella cyperi]|uniref:DNA polymerase Y family protein n=1 Tax=Shewanella cyperi TaxID=2814292 RepID=A0A974XND7_9GAMM|nr:DNA polymerase Y family protein [Shewanella cyperi]QSX31596.1 DNA polymerase Y family protein [Shewanella cyperi]